MASYQLWGNQLGCHYQFSSHDALTSMVETYLPGDWCNFEAVKFIGFFIYQNDLVNLESNSTFGAYIYLSS